ncbi:MAG: radical SAM family heme chaperone HemW [Anaerolineales bacterium]|nr:radical SAM family heme chaperone HemW [Anaerolineales bacterium]
MDCEGQPKAEIAVYIHVPFCRARCAYCDFNTTVGLEAYIPAYVGAVCAEVEAAGRRWGRMSVESIYLGGGTPSLLPLERLAALLTCLRTAFDVHPQAEITLEANPGTVTCSSLAGARQLGVNRLSLGVQSAQANELAALGRIHTWADVVEARHWAREAGFHHVGIDLIFGLPGQRVAAWRDTLQAALSLRPDHLSLYSLSVEEGTPLAQRIASGELPAPDDDTAADMLELAERLLAGQGFFHYEISNWAALPRSTQRVGRWWPARPAHGAASEDVSPFVSRHNLTYWRNEPWLGFGAGAHSWMGGRRWANVSHPQAYIEAQTHGHAPVSECEEIDRRLEIGETMMMGLRLAEGVSDVRFRARFGVGLDEAFGERLAHLAGLRLLTWDGCAVRLTARGRLLGNQVFAEFL